jgi:hypothetical protein
LQNKRRIIFHSGAKEITVKFLHARIPLHIFKRKVWVNLAIDVLGFVTRCFKDFVFQSIDSITITSFCKLRKIFTMRNPLCDDSLRGQIEFPIKPARCAYEDPEDI